MHALLPETELEPGRAGLLESVAAHFAEQDAERSAWLDARIRARHGRSRSPCSACGLKIGHHPQCMNRGRDVDEGSDPAF